MTALAKDRTTPQMGKGRDVDVINLPLAAGAKIYAGSIVCDNGSGYAVPASTSTSLLAVGRAEDQVDNTGGAAGALKINVRRGVFKFANSAAGDAIAIAERFDTCYLVDDQTVAKTDGGATRSRAGIVIDVESDGVWVLLGSDSVLNMTAIEAKALHRLSKTIGHADLTEADGSQDINFDSALPANAVILGLTSDVTAAFAGAGQTYAGAVGSAADPTLYASSIDIDNVAPQQWGAAVNKFHTGAVTPAVRITSNGNVVNADAGAATFHLWYVVLATS